MNLDILASSFIITYRLFFGKHDYAYVFFITNSKLYGTDRWNPPLWKPSGCWRSTTMWLPQCQLSALVQIITCRLFGAKPLSKPMLRYCQWDPQEQNSVKTRIKIQDFSFMKMYLKMSSANRRPFCPGEDELSKLKQLWRKWLNESHTSAEIHYKTQTQHNDIVLHIIWYTQHPYGAISQTKFSLRTEN